MALRRGMYWVVTMIKGIPVVLTIILLAACSGDDSNQPVTKQKVDNPSAANDRVATAKPGSSQSKVSNAAVPDDNPFVKQEDEASSERLDGSENEGQDEDSIADESAGGLALADSESGYMEWQAPTDSPYSNAEINITGPNGEQLKRTFAPGEAIVVDESLADGHYMWESVVTPEIDPSVREQMREVRQAGDFQAEQEMIARLRAQGSLPTEAQAQENRKSGSFSVRNGVATPIPPTYVDIETKQDDPG